VRVLILAGRGMLGHALRRELARAHQVTATVRGEAGEPGLVGGIDVLEPGTLERLLEGTRPQAVLNAVGLVKQRSEAEDAIAAIETNALLPHRLARLCADRGARLVHFSTDCVFSGGRGSYRETDRPDPVDTYGRSKLLGELGAPHLTLRTSIVGLELGRAQGLVEWFLASRGRIDGYRRAIWSGLTTAEMARLVGRLLSQHPALEGLYHVAAEPIDKHELLTRLARELGRDDLTIEPVDEPFCDRSLDGSAFAAATGYRAPSWDEMLRELAQEIRARRDERP
jgi:dTDP-4-dehydrorhamnose reductase